MSQSPAPADHARWSEEEVQPHEIALRGYFRSRFPSIDTDDLVQESCFRLLKARARGSIASSKAYIFAIAVNTARTLFHRGRIYLAVGLEELPDSVVLEEKSDVSVQLRFQLALEAIDRLPPRCREISRLAALQRLSTAHIVRWTGLAEKTIYAQLAIGVRNCSEFLRERGERTCHPKHDPESSFIEVAAANWFVRRREPRDLEAQYRRWLADSRHAAAVAELQATWDSVSFPAAAGRGREATLLLKRRVAARRRRAGFVIATGLAATAAVVVALLPPRERPGVVAPNIEKLPDGSTVELNAGAEIAVDYAPERLREAYTPVEAPQHLLAGTGLIDRRRPQRSLRHPSGKPFPESSRAAVDPDPRRLIRFPKVKTTHK